MWAGPSLPACPNAHPCPPPPTHTHTQVLLAAEDRERRLVGAEETLARRRKDLERDHAARMAEAEAAVRRLQVECEHQLEIERDRWGGLGGGSRGRAGGASGRTGGGGTWEGWGGNCGGLGGSVEEGWGKGVSWVRCADNNHSLTLVCMLQP